MFYSNDIALLLFALFGKAGLCHSFVAGSVEPFIAVNSEKTKRKLGSYTALFAVYRLL